MEATFRLPFLCAVILFCAMATAATAQKSKNLRTAAMKGLEGGFGIQSATIKSSIPELDNLNWVAEGGKVAYVTGNGTLMTKCGLGFLYSTSNVPQTIDLFHSELAVNFYPLTLVGLGNTRINPYLSTGLFYNMYKFGGTYLSNEAEPRNMSIVDEAYLGRVNQVNGMAGAGLEYRIMHEREFLHVFAEGSWGMPILSRASAPDFNGTNTGNIFQAYIGVRFGLLGNR